MKSAQIRKLGKNIANIRKQNNFSQEYLAETIEISKNTISNIERGKTDPKVSTLEAISKALNIEIADLFFGAERTRVEISPTLEIIIENLQKEDEKTLRYIQKIFDTILAIKYKK